MRPIVEFADAHNGAGRGQQIARITADGRPAVCQVCHLAGETGCCPALEGIEVRSWQCRSYASQLESTLTRQTLDDRTLHLQRSTYACMIQQSGRVDCYFVDSAADFFPAGMGFGFQNVGSAAAISAIGLLNSGRYRAIAISVEKVLSARPFWYCL